MFCKELYKIMGCVDLPRFPAFVPHIVTNWSQISKKRKSEDARRREKTKTVIMVEAVFCTFLTLFSCKKDTKECYFFLIMISNKNVFHVDFKR